jgi:ribokinase
MKVLNFGSLNIDYVYSVDHFVRAGETLASSDLELFCGGKGLNQSIAFARAGAQVFHAGCVGKDGSMLTDALKDSGVDTSLVKINDNISTGHAIIQVNKNGENCILLFGGANLTISEDFVREVISNFEHGDLLILQNEINNIDLILKLAHEKGLQTVLNPSPFNEKILALELTLIDWLIVNETEGKELTGKEDSDDILDTLLSRFPHMKIVLTLGDKGSVYADKSIRIKQDIFKAKVVDTTAAGDTFTGYFFSSVMRGNTPAEALRIASAASAIAVSRKGASPSIPTLNEVISSEYLK